MLFNSIDFAIFLPIVFILYWYVIHNHLKLQNLLIVLASYVFYGWWDWRFLTLIVFSTIIDYTIGKKLKITTATSRRKLLLWTSVFVNLGFLGFFKYYNFFLDNFVSAFSFFGNEIPINSLNIILPVGISFYTFQTMSYTIDVYKGKLKATEDFVAFSAFVSFFPQLVAGPIERATNLLPQFYTKRNLSKKTVYDGLGQILWGLFKKIVIADNCAIFVNEIFADYNSYPGSTLLLGSILFAFQIYGDFSGYSDIAIGTAKLFGFNLMQNFAFPYFSRDIAEFWRRWHISLSTWFRDYLYIPLGGSRGSLDKKIRNTFIIFVVSGFWHGANWTFIIWGALNAIYYLPLLLSKKNKANTDSVAEGKWFFSIKEFFQMLLTFCLITVSWVFFRSDTVTDSLNYLSIIFSETLFSMPTVFPIDFLAILTVFIIVEWFSRMKKHPFEINDEFWHARYSPLRLISFSASIWAIILWGAFGNKEFIYFQF
ncbi:MBOAT family O-acyltransferase [Zobellia uliginosa]|uniref:MBOAT family O-acyltransferase n=1 Tax=Zobellia uliginosa TaxID=143224 RepID=UPI001C0709C8|nr:MBOAT family O-acyltransferase [Zobellia uliginosa]MBU2947906.1 MBOAT family protein [Zobellia uliginosa]